MIPATMRNAIAAAERCRVLFAAIERTTGTSGPLWLTAHEFAHFVEIADRWRQTKTLRDFAAGRLSFDAVNDCNTWDLSAMESCEDMKRQPEDCAEVGLRRLYRAEVMALAIATTALPEVDHAQALADVSSAFATTLRRWRGRYAGQVAADVAVAVKTPRARRLGRRLRRIVEEWAAKGGVT